LWYSPIFFLSGQTWDRLAGAPAAYWGAVASSENGSRLVAGAQQLLYREGSQETSALVRSDNFGVSWTPPLENYTWFSSVPPTVTRVTSSTDGSHIAGLFALYYADLDCNCLFTGYGSISISANAGVTFAQSDFLPFAIYTGIAASGDGSTIVAVQYFSMAGPGSVFLSRDFGNTFSRLKNAPLALWGDVAISGGSSH